MSLNIRSDVSVYHISDLKVRESLLHEEIVQIMSGRHTGLNQPLHGIADETCLLPVSAGSGLTL